jgi:ectoine hydroxylase-related dioxygenase (phytanoyl-CoA dioxygenase family)
MAVELLVPEPQEKTFAESVRTFQRDGHVRVRAFYRADEIAGLDDALTRARNLALHFSGDVDASLTRDGFLSRYSAEVATYVMDPKLGALAAELLGASRIRLIHDVMLEKAWQQGETPWHRDSEFWSFTGIGALTMWIPLQDTPLTMSPLRYVSGSHLEPNQHPLHPLEKALIPLRFRVASSALALGDIAIHHFKTLHGAGRNRERRLRRAFAIHLIDADARFRLSCDPRQIEHASRCSWDRLGDGDQFTDEIASLIYPPASSS